MVRVIDGVGMVISRVGVGIDGVGMSRDRVGVVIARVGVGIDNIQSNHKLFWDTKIYDQFSVCFIM